MFPFGGTVTVSLLIGELIDCIVAWVEVACFLIAAVNELKCMAM
jgi:hypothetical protein